jgi:hypothetical protein
MENTLIKIGKIRSVKLKIRSDKIQNALSKMEKPPFK